MSPEETKAVAELQALMDAKRRELGSLAEEAKRLIEKREQTIAEIRESRKARELIEAKAAGFETYEAYDADRQRKHRDRQLVRVVEKRLSAAGMPAIHVRAIQENAVLSPTQRPVFDKIGALIDAGGIVALVGNRGKGKTLLACKLAFDRLPRMSVKYAKVMDFFLDIRDTFRKDSSLTQRDVVRAYAGHDLLILDECHERTGSEWESVGLVDLIDRRYSAGNRPTIMLSNQQRAALADNLGPSICSRVRESGDVFELSGESYRETIRKERMADHG